MPIKQLFTSLEEAYGKLDYSLLNDCLFHVVFQSNPKALLGLCASLLHMHPEEIRSVEVLNPIEYGKTPIDKEFILDLKVMLNDNRILNFEVQVMDENNWSERSLSYACRTFDQLKSGQSYLDVKPVYHIGFLDYDLKGVTPEFYATYKLLNIKNHELYSDKFVLSVVNLNQIDKATEEDRRYGIDHWAQLFKATTWEAIKMIAAKNEYLAEASETMLQSYHDACVRTYCEAVEEARRCRRGLEIRLERAEAQLQEKDEELQATKNTLLEQNNALQAKDEEIARLKALLDATSTES
ncbi:MAG: Rpn family recombination-promoting nuclease/putative transposase [Lachnospiraceae bacterium]|nr:Rpn family recombination-promoting nuclease/putative transposase [Lachnospiraceae bacterium]